MESIFKTFASYWEEDKENCEWSSVAGEKKFRRLRFSLYFVVQSQTSDTKPGERSTRRLAITQHNSFVTWVRKWWISTKAFVRPPFPSSVLVFCFIYASSFWIAVSTLLFLISLYASGFVSLCNLHFITRISTSVSLSLLPSPFLSFVFCSAKVGIYCKGWPFEQTNKRGCLFCPEGEA